MTLSTTETNQQFVGDAVILKFSFTYKILDASHVTVYLDGVLQGTGFTVTPSVDQNTTPGGDVDFAVAPAVGVNVNIVRSVPQNQLTDYVPYDAFPAKTHETALDKLTMLLQELKEVVERNTIPPPDASPGDAIVDGDLTVNGDSRFIGDASSDNAPSAPEHLTRRDYVDGADNILFGEIGLVEVKADQALSDAGDAQSAANAANNNANTRVLKAGDTMTGPLKGVTPVDAEDLTRKDYVDSLGGVNIKHVNLFTANGANQSTGATTIGGAFGTALQVTLTPSNVNAGIRITASLPGFVDSANFLCRYFITANGVQIPGAAVESTQASIANGSNAALIEFVYFPGTVAPQTYQVRMYGQLSGTFTLYGNNIVNAGMTVQEVPAGT